MLPGLAPFGKDFGNPRQDGLFFQIGADREAYRKAKTSPAQPGSPAPCERLRIHCPAERERRAHQAILSWIDRTLTQEYPQLFPHLPQRPDGIFERWRSVGLDIQEDLVAVQRATDGTDAVISVHVCFPSGWRPEHILGWDFRRIHNPVPSFAKRADTASSLARTMIERGPYVRFVWTLCADDCLDHHPEEGNRRPWESHTGRGWLRVERQVTVPFPGVEAALFLIRTYLTPFEALGPSQRKTLATAINCMPAEVLRYKDLNRAAVLQALRASSHEAP